MEEFERLSSVIAKLRAPDGCPWDRVQTHDSLKPYLVEEVYEVLEAIDRQDQALLQEELGDLLLQIVLHAQIATEAKQFTLQDVAKQITEKMIRRHPHVFGEVSVSGTEDVWRNWEQIKIEEKRHRIRSSTIFCAATDTADTVPDSILDSVPAALPALFRAAKVQKKAARVGFDWPDKQGVLEKIKEEIQEFEAAKDQRQQTEEFGDILFSLVNLARKIDLDAEDALRLATNKFEKRFRYVEQQVSASGKPWKDFTLDELDLFWNAAKG